MARLFASASSEKITLSVGALNFAFGPGTIAAIIRTPASFAAATIFSAGVAGTGYAVLWGAPGILQLQCDATSRSGVTALSASTWYLVAVTKATGTVAPRMHFINIATGVATHENSGSTLANSTAPTTRAAIGVNPAGTGNFFNSDINVVGVWNVVLADQDIESLAYSLPPWLANQPKGLWVLDQQAVAQNLPDLSGGGANQSAITGTAVSSNSVPIWTPYGTQMAA